MLRHADMLFYPMRFTPSQNMEGDDAFTGCLRYVLIWMSAVKVHELNFQPNQKQSATTHFYKLQMNYVLFIYYLFVCVFVFKMQGDWSRILNDIK